MSSPTTAPKIDADDEFLDKQVQKESPKNRRVLYMCVALTVTSLPTYLFQAVQDMELSAGTIPFYVAVPLGSAVLLTLAYHSFFEAYHTQYASYINEPRGGKKHAEDDKETTLRQTLRFQAAMGYALFFSNALFLALVLFFQFYLLRAFDKRVNYCCSILAAAGLLWWLAQANEKAIEKKRRMK